MQRPTLKTKEKHRNHASILTVGEVCKNSSQFAFKWVDKDEILKEVLNLDAWKACQDSDIPSRIIKKNADLWIEFLHSSFNNLICQYESPSIFKLANITSEWQKKDDRNFLKNYRSVSILSNTSKFFEVCMFCQIPSFLDPYLAKQQYGFIKGCTTMYCLLVM